MQLVEATLRAMTLLRVVDEVVQVPESAVIDLSTGVTTGPAVNVDVTLASLNHDVTLPTMNCDVTLVSPNVDVDLPTTSVGVTI